VGEARSLILAFSPAAERRLNSARWDDIWTTPRASRKTKTSRLGREDPTLHIQLQVIVDLRAKRVLF
jgi:hypothetical protein